MGLCFIVYEIIFIKRKQKNTTYAMFPFFLSAILWGFFTGCLIAIDLADSENKLNDIPFESIMNSFGSLGLFSLLILQICLTITLYLFSGKYAEYHITYYPKKKRRPLALNYEDSYIVLYGLLKVNKQVIYIRDIIVEESYFVYEFTPSKWFPIAGIIGSKDYLVARLVSGKRIIINCSPFFIYDANNDLLALAKFLKIKIVCNSKQKMTTQ